MSKRLTAKSTGVAHHTPGRTRLRVPKTHRHPKKLKRVQGELEKIPGIKEVIVNANTGSILVHHEVDLPIFDLIAGVLSEGGGDLLAALIEEESGIAEVGAITALIGGCAAGLNKFVGGDKEGETQVSLKDPKTAVPLAFLALGIYHAVVTESLLGEIAPAVLLYWAFDSFWKLNVETIVPDSLGNGHSEVAKIKEDGRRG